MAERPLYTLYKNLKAQNYDVPDDYNKFESALTRDGKSGADNRHAIYENLKAQNFDVPDTYERFYSALFEPRSRTSSRAKGGSVPMSAADRARYLSVTQSVLNTARQVKRASGNIRKTVERAKKFNANDGKVTIGFNNPLQNQNVQKNEFNYNATTGKAGTYTTTDGVEFDNEYDAAQYQNQLDKQGQQYINAVNAGEIPSVFDVRNKNGNYDLQENIGKNGTYLTEEGAQKQFDKKLADAYARKKEIEALIAEDNRQHGNPLLSYSASIGASNGRTAEQSDYSNKLATSLALVKQQIGALEAVKQYPTSSWGEDALKALNNTAFTAKTWDFGLTDFATMGQMERIKTKMDNNIPLSGSDKMLLKSKLGADAATALEDEKMGNIYRWTKIAGQSLPFMADFFLTGGYGGITKGISRGALKFAAKRGMGKVSAAILKNTGIVAGDVIGSYAMAGTEQALKTGADIMQRHLGNLYQDEKGDYKFGTFDENGNLLHEGGESMGTALYKGLTSAMVENYTEKLFGHNYGIKKGAVNLMEKHGMNASAEFFKNIGKSGWYTNSKKWMEKFGINGFAEEVMEEEIGIPLHALLDGEGKVSDLLDAKQQLDIIGGMAISVGSMYAMGAGSRPVKGIYNRAQYYRFRNKVNVADIDAQNLMGDNWSDIKDKIDNATNEQMGSVLSDILRQRDTMTKEQINAAVNYGVNLMKMRGYNIAKTAEMNAREITNEPTTPEEQHQADIDNAYSEGHDADDADKHDIQIQQEDQMKTLSAALGISEQQLSAMSDEELESLTGQDDKLDQAIYDYQLSSARYQGVVDDAQDKVDLAAHQAEQRVDMYTDHSRGSVRNATIKASGGLEDYGVYIISGNIATNEDGSIDVSNSDDMILYYDPTTNSVEHADALMFAELGEELPADDVKAQAVADAKENAIKEIAGIIDGTVEAGSQFSVTDTDGTEHTYEILADNGDGTAMITIDGNVPTELVNGENVQIPYSFADLQHMKDLEDQKRLEAAKAEREQMEKERAAQQTQETEQTQPSFDFNQILNDNGNVVLADVLGKDGNTKYPNSQLFLIRDSGAKAKVVELKSDGTLVPHAVNKKDVRTATTMSLDEYKQAFSASSMIEDNSGENRGEIEAEPTTIEDETTPEVAENTETTIPADETAETPSTEQTPAITLEDGTIVPMLDDGNPDFSKLTAAQTAELYDTQFGEDAESVISSWVSDSKKALDKANNMTVKGKTFVEQKASKDAKEKAIADAQAAYDSAIAIRDAYNERQLAKVEDTAEGRKNLIEKARRKFARLKSSVKDDAEAVAQIYKETVGSLLHRLYDSTGIDVTDTIPLTAEEYVASNLGAHSLNYEGTETSKSVKQETGLSREDFAKTQLLAADGKGTTIDALVHSLWENRPSNLDSLDTQDIRNALIGVLTSGFKASEARSYVENIRIAQAEKLIEEERTAAENAAYYEQQKAKEEEEKKKAELEKKAEEEKEKSELEGEEINPLAERITETDDEAESDGKYGTIYNKVYLIDGDKRVTKVDEPDANGNYTGSYYMYDGKRFGDLFEVADYIDGKAEEKTHSESFNKIVDLAKNLEEILDNPDNVKEIDKITNEIDELMETLSDEEFKEVSDVLLNIDEDLEYLTSDEYERRVGVEESKKAKDYNESMQQAIKRIAPYADALKAAVKSGDKKDIAKAQKELTDALLASNLGHGYLSGQLKYAKSAKKKDESYSERRALVKPLTDAINAIESALDSALAESGLEGVHVDFTEGGHGWIYADKGSAWSSRLKALDNDYRNVSQYETQNPISVLPQVTIDNVENVAGIIKSRIEEGERYNSDEYNDDDEQTNENINAPEQTKFPDKLKEGSETIEVPEDATDEKPLGEQLDETDLPFSAKENGKQQTTAERDADVEKNKVDDMKVVDNIVGNKTRKAFERLAKMMGANIQWQYSDKLGNGWIQETKDPDGNVHRTIFITLDSSITEGAQFIFGHEMTHQIKNLNPAAYNELTQLVLDTYGSGAFDKAVDETMKRYSDAGFSGRNRDYYAEEVVADAVGEMIRDLNLAHTLAMKMSHPLLAAIHEILQKIKLAFFGTEYSDITKNIIRSIEQAYVKTAKGRVVNSETGEDVSFSLRQKPEPKKKGVGYKVFVLKDGKLYPPMVANPDGAATPVGVWLNADAAPIAGESKTGRPQVKHGGKGTQGGSGKLAYRPGWHLGVVPYAIQFNRKDADGNKTLFPKNFVFAEVEYAADVDYQEEARQEGINPSGKYQHSLAGLKHLPTDGYYMYRTNPNPETDPWVITGAMKVNRILTRAEQAELVKNAGREPQQIQEGDIVTDDVVNSINQEIADAPKFSLKSKPVRFEAGKKLSDEEKKEVLSTLKDAYKVNGVPYHIEETAGGKEKRVYEPTADSYVVSDITNRPLRYYITLPDGRVAHPTEVYPNISDNEVKSSATKQGLLDDEADQIVSAAIGNMKDIADNAKAIEVLTELQNLPHETHDVGYGMNNAQSYNYKTGIFTSDADQAIDYVVRRMRRKEDVPADIPAALKKAVADSYGMVDNLIGGMSSTKFSLKDEKIKSVAEKFGVNEDDVAMYANAVERGSTADAARARANIKRYLLQANEDKISSFKELMKYTVPVNEALKENFGDLDAMIEERRKQVEAQRNAMEAARKRAQEEEEKRHKHLYELSLIPTDELDKRYMDAIANNDESTAREMLDESARRNGYGDIDSDYQGQGAWAAPSNPQYESDEARRADIENSPDVNLEDIALGYSLQPDDYFDNPRAYMNNTAYGLESALVIKNALDAIKNGEKDVKVKVYRAVPTSVKEGKLRNGDWVTPSKKYAEMHGDNRLEGKYRIIEDEVPANQLWWDGNDANEFGFDDGKEYRYKNAKNNRKLNDLVTYDNKGNVIPPSKRFNSRKNDIRFSLKEEKEKIVADAKANGTYMKAPNGEKTKLNAEQWATVRTTNFKNWFGDWENDPENASKVVDENGEPMVVWHGRSAEFNTFEKKEGVRFIMGLEDKVKAEGFFFSPDKGLAEEFASNSYRHRGGKANVVPCFLNIRRPMDLTGEDYDRIYEDVTGWEYMVGMDTQDNLWGIMDEEGMAEKIKEKGYDGAIFVEEVDDSYDPTKVSYCALDANQIKSADNNNGNFSADNNDIRFSLKAMMEKPEGWKQANKKAIHIAEAIERDPKFSLKNLDGTLIKAGTYFSGGGLVEEGLKGIIDPVVAVEYDEKISGVYRNNFGQHIVTADVRDVDPKELVKHIDGEVEYFHASPVCKNYSQAKSNHAEVELDKETAASTSEFINAVKPKVVTIENVKGYKDSDAMKIITDALDANGYTWDADVYNAADYGGYTNRERLIVRAVRDGKLPEKPKKMAHKSGWYEAVADIIPTLTEKKNGVAPWMDIRLKADGIDWRNIDKPLYVMGSAYADGKVPHAFADELLPTLRTKSGDVIVMPDGKVYRAMGRVLARVSGVSDDYKMPFSENLSHTIIGNGIPTQLTEHVIAPLLQNTLRPTTPDDGNSKFSLRYDKFEHDLNQWKKDNNLPKDAQRPTIPQRNVGESAVDFLRRVDEYRKQMALWKTAPTYEQHLLSDDTAIGEFNRELQLGSVLKRIAFQDSMLAIRKAQEAVMKEVGVDRLNMAEDAYTAENRSHGKGKNEFEEYNNEFLQPLRKAYHQMKKVLGDSYDNVRIYMMAKHGLERDAQMAFKKSLEADYEDVAQRSAAYRAYKGDMNRITNDSDLEFGRVDFNTWRQRDNAIRAKYSPSYMNYRYDKDGTAYDYSGLSALFGGIDFEEAASKLVRDIESSHVAEVQDLWNATNAATKKILRDGYKAGMMSKDTYQYVRDMYSHYIPLRGWDGTTADQVWDYVGGGKGAFNQTLKTAHGRTSIADDPIAYIENMAESGILLNNKNWVKQHLMILAQNHPTSLLTLSKAWYVKSTDANGNEEWIPATPQITSQMNSNQVKAAIDAFEKKMEQMAQNGDATQKRDGLNIAYPQTHSEEREHEVRVMKDGEEYVIYVNGDPQLAQAMNNTRAHRVREIQSGKLDRAAAWLGRKMAAAYTSLSPLFIPSNYFRDLTMTLASTAIREDAKYNYLLRKNLATSWNLGFMLRDYQSGKLREKVSNGNATPKEQMFYDFMMNGGETGFVSSLDVEDLKKKFKNDLKDLDRLKANPVKVGHAIMDSIEFLNRAIEDSNRFAVYMTSIQYGRSIDEAVNDAKNVTLNFNRKGTGEYGWQMIRNLYLFINPAVQSLQTLGALAKHHPFKFTAVTASWIASGVLVPIVNAALMSLFGGDDDKDKYWQFTKWDRRNNLIMWVPFTHEYVKIPLAQEFRAFYGLGDMIASKMMGGELAEESWIQYGEDLLGQVVDMLPLDPTGYDGNIAVSLMPNAIRPVFELAFNVDFTGKPLFKDTEYNKYDPNFTKAYVGTPDWLVRASKMVNSIGNDYPDVQQNSIDAFGDPRYNLNNPAVVDHVLSSYLGGAYTMGSQVLGVLTKSLNDPNDVKVADIPLFSKFVSNPDDRPVTKKQGDEFWNMKENHDRVANTLSKLKKQAKVDGDYSMLERFYGSEEYKQYKQDDVKVKKYEEDKKKERAEESGEEYRPHKLNAEDIYKAHATPKDDFEDLKLKQLYTKLNGFKTSYDLLVDTAPSQSDGYYNTNKAAIDAIDEISLDKQEISELKKGFLDDGKDAYNAEDMKQIRELRKKILAVLEKANKVVVANQKENAKKK